MHVVMVLCTHVFCFHPNTVEVIGIFFRVLKTLENDICITRQQLVFVTHFG